VYLAARTLISMPKTAAVISYASGAEVSVIPADWNARAWKLATDFDPSRRDPAEAVRLAELAVAADPKNLVYVRTLGVARYRAGDLNGAIEALKRSNDGSGYSGPCGFFLAMAHARLGQDEEAGRSYLEAHRWMRQKYPNNSELRRFREEAATVLDVAGDKALRKPPAPSGSPLPSKNARPAAKPN
jgi:Flp pilus assembly protein TadD